MRGSAGARWIAVVLLALPSVSFAGEVWKSADASSSLELRAFYKTFGSFLRVPDPLLDETAALQSLFDQARAQLPPDASAQLPTSAALPRTLATTSHLVRLWGKLVLSDRVTLDAGWQIAATTGSEALLGDSTRLGGALPSLQPTAAATRRLVDFSPVLASGGGFLLQHNLDLLALRVALPRGELVIGRQILSWGTGRFWNPTDLLSPFAPTDVDKEVRHGVDAVRWSMPLGSTALLDVMWLPRQRAEEQGGVLRAQANVAGYDVSLSAAKYLSDIVLGADATGDVGPLGVHGEAAYTLALDGLGTANPVTISEQFLRAVAGVEWRPLEPLILEAEYHFNGSGTLDPSQYLSKLQSPRVRRGEIFGAGRHYAAMAAVWKATELLTVSATVITNLRDPSAIALPVLEYWFEQNVILRAGGYLGFGRAPDTSAVLALTVDDLLAHDEAWTNATGSLGFRSEYGATPAGAFIQVGIYY